MFIQDALAPVQSRFEPNVRIGTLAAAVLAKWELDGSSHVLH
jgi:hypothetical protein